VELNEPHHWGMRDAPDVLCVVSAYLAACNAKTFGVKDYIAQLMFNSPAGLSDAMDLAKMAAMLRIIEPLREPDFRIWKQTRTGLLSYPLNPEAAKAHLATSIYLQMALKPDIVHIVGYSEADHVATADDVIESSLLARRAVENAMRGAPDMLFDPKVKTRINWLVHEAEFVLDRISALSEDSQSDALTDPRVLAKAVTSGIMDAPQLKNNPFGKGNIHTRVINGACKTVNHLGKPTSESYRITNLVQK
jgi:hypothetical protein